MKGNKNKYAKGGIVRISEDNDNDNYDDYRGKDLRIVSVAYDTSEHQGYDESMDGMGLYDLEVVKTGEKVPFSLYEYEVEEYAKGGKISKGDKEIAELLKHPFLKLRKTDSRRRNINIKIGELEWAKENALYGSDAYNKFNEYAKGGMITEESNYDIIANVKKEHGESDFYYELYDKLVANGERPKIAFSEMKEVFDNYEENISDYIDLPFAKGGKLPKFSQWEKPITQKERDKRQETLVPLDNDELDRWIKFDRFKKTLTNKMEKLGVSEKSTFGTGMPGKWQKNYKPSEYDAFPYGYVEFTHKGKDYFLEGQYVFQSKNLKELLSYNDEQMSNRFAKGGVTEKDQQAIIQEGSVIEYVDRGGGDMAEIGYRDFYGTSMYYIMFNAKMVHSSKTYKSMLRKLNQLKEDYNLEYRGVQYAKGGQTKYEGAEITGMYNEYGSAYQDEVEDAVRDLTSEQYEAFCYDYNVDPNNANEMSDFIANLDQEEAEDIMTHIRTTGELEDRMKGMGYAKGGKLPSQEEVDKSFSEWEMETHYLNNKPVKGQKPSSNKVEIDEWDKYDLSNWNALVSSNRKIKKFSKGGKVGMIKTSKKAHSLVDTTEKVKEINKKIRKNGLTFIYDYGWLTTSDNYPGVYVKSEPFRIKDEMIIDLKDGEIGYGDTLERIIVKTPKNLNGQEFLDWHFKQIENFFREPISVDKWTDHLIFDEMGELSSHNTTNFAKGGEVKKKGNEMLIGGLAGILLGIFLNK